MSMFRSTRTSHRARAIGGGIAVAIVLAVSTAQPTAAAPSRRAAAACPRVTWGSTPRSSAPMTTSPITNVRAGRHQCFDRLVVDLRSGPKPGFEVHYGRVTEQGTGFPIAVRGGAAIEIIVKAPTYDQSGHGTYDPANDDELVNVAGYKTFRQVVTGGSFEGYTTFGIGTRARLPFRVFTLTDSSGTRLVIDVAHRWT